MGFYRKNSWWIIDLFNKNKLTSKIFVFLKKHIRESDFKIDSMPTVRAVEELSDRVRCTIVLPSLRKSKVFGGVNTALKFFQGLLNEGNTDGRIIVMSSEHYSDDLTVSIEGFTKNEIGRTLIFLSDTDTIRVREKEVFIFTTWSSAFVFTSLFNWQRDHFKNPSKKVVYFIQDFEPGFAAWSARYALADSTYRNGAENIAAVFNSKELYDYFKFNHYQFGNEIYFKPTLNDTLKKILIDKINSKNNWNRKKQIIFYGRPNEPRNAYEIIRYTLAKWSREYSGADTWEIYSLGAPGDNVKLENNVIVNKGKIALDEYAKYMEESFIGISLMVSPHPSYPPLEMSTYGVKTITNNFANKDLTGFNENLYTVDQCSPNTIYEVLVKLCNSYDGGNAVPSINKEYVNGRDFWEAIRKTAKLIQEFVED